MIISISGTPGSGKSTIGKEVAKKLKLKHYSLGDFTRKLAEKHKMSVLEYMKSAEKDENIDKEIDDVQIELGNKEDNFVIDSRLGYYFIPHSIKIFLKCSAKESAKRIFSDKNSLRKLSEKENITLKDTEETIKKRMETDRKRYKQYYGLDFMDEKGYDLVIDTTSIKPDEAVNKILKFVKEYEGHRKKQEDEIKEEEEKYFKVMKNPEGRKAEGKKGKKEDDAGDEEDDMDDDFDDDNDDFDDKEK